MNLLRYSATTVCVAALAVCLAGCAPTTAPVDPGPTPTAPAEPSGGPTSAPPVDDEPAAATCENVLDAASIDAFASHGYTLSDDFVERGRDQGWPIMAFVNYGGILCQWGYANSDASEYYGLSEITPEGVAAETARLTAEGFAREPHPAGELFIGPPTEGFQEHYLFAGDHWFVAFSPSRLDEIRRNAGLA
jgi:hypothetical protein